MTALMLTFLLTALLAGMGLAVVLRLDAGHPRHPLQRRPHA